MTFVTADGRAIQLDAEVLEATPVSPDFAAAMHKEITEEFERSLQDGSANKHDSDWATLGHQPVGAEHAG